MLETKNYCDVVSWGENMMMFRTSNFYCEQNCSNLKRGLSDDAVGVHFRGHSWVLLEGHSDVVDGGDGDDKERHREEDGDGGHDDYEPVDLRLEVRRDRREVGEDGKGVHVWLMPVKVHNGEREPRFSLCSACFHKRSR